MRRSTSRLIFSKQTVFTLGAGASAPCDLGTGKKQLDETRTLTVQQSAEFIGPCLALLPNRPPEDIAGLLPSLSPFDPHGQLGRFATAIAGYSRPASAKEYSAPAPMMR